MYLAFVECATNLELMLSKLLKDGGRSYGRGCQKLTYKFHLLILIFDSSFACNIFCYSSMKFELKPLPSKTTTLVEEEYAFGDLLLQYKFSFLCSMFLILMLGNAKTTC